MENIQKKFWNCIFSSFKKNPSSKIDIWPFLKWQNMEFGQNNFFVKLIYLISQGFFSIEFRSTIWFKTWGYTHSDQPNIIGAFYALAALHLWHHQSILALEAARSLRETLSPQCDLSAANIITNSKPIIERGENVRRAKSGCNRLDSRTEQPSRYT